MSTKAIAGGVVHKMPVDLRKAITSTPAACPPAGRREHCGKILRHSRATSGYAWVVSGKKAETRNIRIEKVLSKLKEGMRRPCCWAGCIHR